MKVRLLYMVIFLQIQEPPACLNWQNILNGISRNIAKCIEAVLPRSGYI